MFSFFLWHRFNSLLTKIKKRTYYLAYNMFFLYFLHNIKPFPLTPPKLVLTCGRLVAVVSVSEVLRVLYHWYSGHADHHSVRSSIQRTRGYNPMIDMMERAGRVFFTADNSYRTCETEKVRES